MGVLIWWESQGTDMPPGGSKADRETLLDISTAEYTARDFPVIVELWKVDDSKRKKFVKITSFHKLINFIYQSKCFN